MKEVVQVILDKADEFIADGIYLLEGTREAAAANRAYYAVFTAARAALFSIDIEAKSHNGVQTKFREHFIKTGIFDMNHNQTMSVLSDVRQRVDYDIHAEIELEEAQLLMGYAVDFVEAIRAYLLSNSNP